MATSWVKLICVSMLFAVYICAQCGTLASIDDLLANSSAFQEQLISVRGYVGIDELGHEYLFATLNQSTAHNWSESIDLVSETGTPKVATLHNATCAEVYGKFLAYGSRYIPTGYLLSKAGMIEIKRISSCPSSAAPSSTRP